MCISDWSADGCSFDMYPTIDDVVDYESACACEADVDASSIDKSIVMDERPFALVQINPYVIGTVNYHVAACHAVVVLVRAAIVPPEALTSEERRVGQECVGHC